jgi:plastocyanin
MKRAALGWFLAFACLGHVAASAGTIHGTLRIGPKVAAVKAGTGSRPLPRKMRAQLADAVVYLDKVPAKVEKELAEKKPPQPIIGQFETRFIPRVTPVVAGTKVLIENQDRIYQNAFSVSPAKKFDIGKLAPRRSAEVVFDKPGVVKLYNDLEPTMSGFVLVLSNQAFARPDSTGSWSFQKLPRGKYRVRAWHPTLGSLSRSVEVPGRGEVRSDLNY